MVHIYVLVLAPLAYADDSLWPLAASLAAVDIIAPIQMLKDPTQFSSQVRADQMPQSLQGRMRCYKAHILQTLINKP